MEGASKHAFNRCLIHQSVEGEEKFLNVSAEIFEIVWRDMLLLAFWKGSPMTYSIWLLFSNKTNLEKRRGERPEPDLEKKVLQGFHF